MGVDFNTLISQPQVNSGNKTQVTKQQPSVSQPPSTQTSVTPAPIATPVATAPQAQTAPVLAKPLVNDTFSNAQTSPQAPTTMDKVLKYSGLASIAALPLAIVVDHKIMSKNVNKMVDKVLASFKGEVTRNISEIKDGVASQLERGMSDVTTKMTEASKKADGDLANKITAVVMSLFGVNEATNLISKIGNMNQSSGVQNRKEVELSEPTTEILNTEATKRIEGKYPWPQIDHVNAWMLSAETQTFMKTGGLAEVAVQLPDAFNNKHSKAGDKDEHVDIITPMYTGTGKKSASIEKVDDHYVYTGAEGKKIDVKKVGSFDVRVYNEKTNNYKKEPVEVFEGEFGGTKYVFMKNDKYFDVTPSAKNHPACQGPYVTNKNGIGEVERMAFMSKAAYQLMINSKEGKVDNVTAPNVVVANDWHASPITSLMRYDAPVQLEQKKLSSETYDYIEKTPVIHITHNAQYQGADNENADKIFRTLFEENTDAINANIRGYGEEGFPLATGLGNYNSALSDLNLADRGVAVSSNYANELCKAEDLGCGLQDVNRVRQQHGTMLGIVNGYTKSLSEPNEKFVSKVNDVLKPEKPFVSFDKMYNDEGYAKKLENKATMVDVLNDMAQKAKAGEPIYEDPKNNQPKLIDAENCEIPKNIDLTKVPMLATVGRFDNQKGFDYMAASLHKVLNNLQPGQEPPIVAILGNGNPDITKQLSQLKADLAKDNPEAAKRVFIFDGFSAAIRDSLGLASDFFMIPSKWEPCGLTQMESMPKGSLPIATSTGGLVDTIKDGEDGFLTDVFYGYATNEKIYDNKKSGFIAPHDNVEAYSLTLNRALDTYYQQPDKIKDMAINAMKKDFSWDVEGGALSQYEQLFRTGKVNQPAA